MSKLLFIKASPRGGRSYSLPVAEAFVDAYQGAHPNDDVITLNLFKTNLPAFDGLAVEARYLILHGEKHTEMHRQAWKEVEGIIEFFTSADKYVLATPMWNFSIPYRLKQYLDILIQPTYTFTYTPEEGYKGLVTGKPILVVYARGGEYPAETGLEAFNFQSTYLELILKFIGFTDIRSLVVEPTLMKGPEVARTMRDEAIKKAQEMARTF